MWCPPTSQIARSHFYDAVSRVRSSSKKLEGIAYHDNDEIFMPAQILDMKYECETSPIANRYFAFRPDGKLDLKKVSSAITTANASARDLLDELRSGREKGHLSEGDYVVATVKLMIIGSHIRNARALVTSAQENIERANALATEWGLDKKPVEELPIVL